MDGMRDRLIELIREVCTVACTICCDTDSAEYMAGEFVKAGALLPPCKVGDTAYMLLEDNVPVHKWYISEERVTEVGARGFWLSGVEPAEDDLGVFIPYDEVGSEAFFDRAAAEATMKIKEVAQDGVD